MKTNFLEKNPFFILGVLPREKRTSIISKAEEKSFFLDNSDCEDAQTKLLNPAKRLIAELDWFFNITDDRMSSIYECINHCTEISTDGLTGVSKLNATLHNFSITQFDDYFEIGYAILDIDELYNEIYLDELTEMINIHHESAGIRLVTEAEVDEVLNKKRTYIRNLITAKMQFLDKNDYIELTTIIAENCIADNHYEDGIIISDVVDQYEIRMQSEIEQLSDAIISHTNRIKGLENDEAIDENILGLIRRVKKWDRIVQPLQLRASASGVEHSNSENIGCEIRELVVYLNNEKGKTDSALKLVNAMKEVFAELDNLSEVFENDSETLNEIMVNDRDLKDILLEIDVLKSMADQLIISATSLSVDNFIAKVKELNIKIKSSYLSTEINERTRENVCLIAREAAIKLHNDRQQGSYTFKIIIALASEFGDLMSVGIKLVEDIKVLEQELKFRPQREIRQEASVQEENSKSVGCLVAIIIFVIIILFICISRCASSDSSSSYSSYSSGNYDYLSSVESDKEESSSTVSYTTAEILFSQDSDSYENVYVDILSIRPSIGIGYTNISNTDVACECETSTGETAWIYMSVYQYNKYFDSTADISNSFYADYEVVEYSSAKRIHGTARRAESLCEGLSSDTGTMVLEFDSIE